VGIFKKILQKKEKAVGKPSEKHDTPKQKDTESSGRVDPLAPPAVENKGYSPPSSAEDSRSTGFPEGEALEDYLQTDASAEQVDATIEPKHTQKEERIFSSVPTERPDIMLAPVPRKIREAERALSDMDRNLAEVSSLFRGSDVLPRLKILLVEAKIRLAEAEIKLSESEMNPASSRNSGEIENRISLAEGKIVEAEKILSSLPSSGAEKSGLSRLKIGVAGIKIRLAEIQIALAGSSLEESLDSHSVAPTSVNVPVPESSATAVISDNAELFRVEIRDETPITRSTDPPKEVRIREDLQPGDPSTERRNDPVRIREEDRETEERFLSPSHERGERIIMPDMESESSPFETGINLNRVQIQAEDTSGIPPTAQERVKIRSDERESAWVTEDGSLKIVSREKALPDHPGEEEKPRIHIQLPEVEKALIIEDLNRKGIEQRKRGEIEDALRSFERVLEIDPTNEAALHNKGVALRSSGQYAEALACFDRAQERDPDNPVILFNRGFCLGKLERFEEAVKAFDRVLALNPENASGWFNKGKILQKMGRTEEAEEHLHKAQELGYH
jgi:tetratricopeptide (TPR) repeat protein